MKRRYVSGKTKEETIAKLRKEMARADSGLVYKGDNETLHSFLERWLEDSVKGNVRPRTFANYRLQVRRHIIPALGHKKLRDLAPADIRRLYRSKLD